MTNRGGYFEVEQQFVKHIADMLEEVLERSAYTTFHVPAVDFGAWCAAAGTSIFYAHESKSGYRHLATPIITRPSHRFGDARFTVAAEIPAGGTPPEPWIDLPAGEGSREHKFQAVMR